MQRCVNNKRIGETYMRIQKEYASERIILRPINDEDTMHIVAWRNKECVRKNFVFQEIFTEEIHRNWLKTKVACGKVEQFVILETSSRKPIGSVYLRDIDYSQKTAEYGIFIGEDTAVGKGYGTNAAKLMLEIAFGELKLEKVYLRVYMDNKAAIRCYEKVGFIHTQQKEMVTNKDGRERMLIFMEKLVEK